MSSRLMKDFHFHPACFRHRNVAGVDRQGLICDRRHVAKAFAEARGESIAYRIRTFCQIWRLVESGAGLT